MSIGDPYNAGPAELEVRVSKLRTMRYNHFGQFSVITGLALALIVAACVWAGGFYPYQGSAVFLGLYFFSGAGLHFGVRGFKASLRGLATNRVTCIVGGLLCGGFIVVQTVFIVDYYFLGGCPFPGHC